MRSLMFVPGHNQKLYDSASNSNADVLLFDLEDSVQPPENKALARELIKKNTFDPKFNKFYKLVRLNEIETEHFLRDVLETTKANINGFLLSKTETANDIVFLDKLLRTIEREREIPLNKFKIIPILETTKSIVNIKKIATSSDRIIALGFGSEDFVSDLQGIRDFGTDVSIFNPRSYTSIVARANNLQAIDAAYIKVHDLEGLENHIKIGKTLGYSGMWVLHPKQNSNVNKAYAPSKEDYTKAQRTIELYKQAIEENKGVAIIDGEFIGPPLVVKAKNTISFVEKLRTEGKELFID
jgi:citrate lyase subunit beta/citryl-CoA lyase